MLLLAQALEDADEVEAEPGKGAKAAGAAAVAAATGGDDSPAKMKEAAAISAATTAKKSSATGEKKSGVPGKPAAVTTGVASVPSSSSPSSSSAPSAVTPSAPTRTPVSTRASGGVEVAAESCSLPKGVAVAASPGGAGSPLSTTEMVGAGGGSREEAMVLELPDDHGHMVSGQVYEFCIKFFFCVCF